MPIVLNDMVLSIGGTDVAAEVSRAVLTPNQSTVSFKGLKPGARFTAATDDGYTLEVNVAQEWADPNSLSNYLWEHKGETIADCVLEPQSGVGQRWTFDLVITAGSVGGEVDSVGESTVTLGIDGEPVKSTIV